MSRKMLGWFLILIGLALMALGVWMITESASKSDEQSIVVENTVSGEQGVVPTKSTFGFTDQKSKMGRWVLNPTCPKRATDRETIRVSNSEGSLSSSVRFGDDGMTPYVILQVADDYEILMVYEIRLAPLNPDGGTVPWSHNRYKPEFPSDVVKLRNKAGFTAGDRLMVCTRPSPLP